jgi:hypothetical protein
VVNPCAAGIDVGSKTHYLALGQRPEDVYCFGVTTTEHQRAIDLLHQHHITTIAMESTGAYWQPLFNALQQAGFEVLLVNGTQTNFEDKQAATQWVEQQKELFLQSQASEVVMNIETLPPRKQKQSAKIKRLAYLEANFERLDYQHYQSIGCGIIGSGAIESAHRTVVQKRMKLSGQRWSRRGAKNMLNLRVVYMNKQWTKVIDLAKTPLQNSA